MRGPGAPHDNDTETLSPIIVVGFEGAGSHRVIGLFFAPFPLSLSWVLGGPRGKFRCCCRTDSAVADFSDDAVSRSDPTSHARIPRMTVVATQLPQIIIIIIIGSCTYRIGELFPTLINSITFSFKFLLQSIDFESRLYFGRFCRFGDPSRQ